jgi:hypothetical protein
MHHIFPAEVCFQSIHIMHVCFTYIMVIIYIGIACMSCLIYYENRYTKDPTAK